MICCDRQAVGCHVWYHYDCLGLSLSDGLLVGASENGFVCPHCSADAVDIPGTSASDQVPDGCDSPPILINSIPHFDPCVDFQWGDIAKW